MGHAGMRLTFRNTGRTCTLRGYPTVEELGPGGIALGQAESSRGGYLGGAPVRTIRLARGAAATALFEGQLATYGSGPTCVPYQQIRIKAPQARHGVVRPMPQDYWYCEAEIHPVVRAGR